MRVLVARLDNDGDVLLTGPAVRAIAAHPDTEITFLCRPSALEAAALLPGVARTVAFEAPWISASSVPLDPTAVQALIATLAGLALDQAIIMTSFHQSPLPLALLLRMAGVAEVAAICEDYPGTLLDVRHRVPDLIHEVERNLSLVATLGYHLPSDDDRRLQISPPCAPLPFELPDRYVAVHAGASVPARALPPDLACATVDALVATGRDVVVTGGPREWTASWLWPRGVINLAGATDLATLALVLAGASALVVGNTGPAHLAAAVGTPVVSIYAPTVPLERWHPWCVPHVVLGNQEIPCRHCRRRSCPILGQPCTAIVTPAQVLDAVNAVGTVGAAPPPGRAPAPAGGVPARVGRAVA